MPWSTLSSRDAETRSRASIASLRGMMNVSIMFVSPLRYSHGMGLKVYHSNGRALGESMLFLKSNHRPMTLDGVGVSDLEVEK